jgi:hypothetical protein
VCGCGDAVLTRVVRRLVCSCMGSETRVCQDTVAKRVVRSFYS